MMEMKVAVAGTRASVAGFRALGFEVFTVLDPADVRDLWPRLTSGEFAVVFVTEPVYVAIGDLVAAAVDKPVPAVTVIPGAGSPGGMGQQKIDLAIERALGTTVLIREEDG